MMKESVLFRILSYIHLVFFTSILWVLTVVLSGSILLLPSLVAIFRMGREVIYKEYDVNNSVIKDYYQYLKSSLRLLKFIPINIMIILNLIGIVITTEMGNMVYSVICLVIVSFLLTFVLYIAGFHVFVGEENTSMEVAVSMFLKPLFLIPVFILMVLTVLFFSKLIFFILLFTGTFFLFAIEVVVFIQMLYFKEFTGTLKEEDEFSHLINRNTSK